MTGQGVTTFDSLNQAQKTTVRCGIQAWFKTDDLEAPKTTLIKNYYPVPEGIPDTPLTVREPRLADDPAAMMLDFLCARSAAPSAHKALFRKALLEKRNKKLLKTFFEAIALELEHLNTLAQAGYPDPVIQARVSSMLSYLAFTEPDVWSETIPEIKVPVKGAQGWYLQSYQMNTHRLTHDWSLIASPYCAYSLDPIGEDNLSQKAPPMMLFMGTSYPRARGGFWTYVADFIPFLSVGRLLFAMGRKTITQWLKQYEHQDRAPIAFHGQSLGGAMSLYAAELFEDKKVHAYANVPAGHWKIGRHRYKGNNATVYMQGQDFVSKIGHVPESATCYYTAAAMKCNDETAYAQPNTIAARAYSHAASLCSHPDAVLCEVSADWQKQQPNRHLWTALWMVTAILFMPVLLFCTILNCMLRLLTFWFKHEDAPKRRPAKLRSVESSTAGEALPASNPAMQHGAHPPASVPDAAAGSPVAGADQSNARSAQKKH